MAGIDVPVVEFGEPIFLWLLVLPAMLFAAWLWQVLQRRSDIQRYENDRQVPVRERYALVGGLGLWWCVLLATVLCITALAEPRARLRTLRNVAAVDIIILQDGSASMYVADVQPDRWRRAVRFLRTFAQTVPWKGDRVALSLFAELAAPQLRLTRDPNALFFFLDHLSEHSPFRLEDNPTWDTNIEEGLYWGLKILHEDQRVFGKSRNPRAFVIVTDGQAWSGNIARALATARGENVPVYAVGVGTPTGGLIPEPSRKDGTAQAASIRATLDRASLIALARAGGGDYFELGREPDADIAARILSDVKRRAPVQQVETSDVDLYWRLLLGAAACVVLGAAIFGRRAELWWQAVGALVTAAALLWTIH